MGSRGAEDVPKTCRLTAKTAFFAEDVPLFCRLTALRVRAAGCGSRYVGCGAAGPGVRLVVQKSADQEQKRPILLLEVQRLDHQAHPAGGKGWKPSRNGRRSGGKGQTERQCGCSRRGGGSDAPGGAVSPAGLDIPGNYSHLRTRIRNQNSNKKSFRHA